MGILGTIYVFCIHPILIKIVSKIPQKFSKKLAGLIIFIYFSDFAISVLRISNNPDILYKLVNP